MALKVVVVGGGIAGFATAIGFAKHGHQVVVLERRQDTSEESGSAIQLQPNAIKILRQWGMMGDLKKIAHDNEVSHIFNGVTGEHVVTMEYSSRGGQWIGLRKDMRILFQKKALEHGATILFNRRVRHVEGANKDKNQSQEQGQRFSRPVVVLEDGQRIEGDMVIGADGVRSKIRTSLFPDYQPTVLPECCFQVRIPFATMRADPDTAPLVEEKGSQAYSGPGKSTFSSVIMSTEVFDLQVIDHHYSLEQDPHPETWTEPWEDTNWLQERFGDHTTSFRKALAAGGKAVYKWRFVLVKNLPSWRSENGRIVLVGDACHAMPPYSGQGSGMGIEDAAVLSQLFAKAAPEQDLEKLAYLYEKIRRPRCEVIQRLAQENGRAIAVDDVREQQRWKVLLRHLNAAIQASTKAGVVPDGKAHFATPEFAKWMDDYDLDADVRAALKQSGLYERRANL